MLSESAERSGLHSASCRHFLTVEVPSHVTCEAFPQTQQETVQEARVGQGGGGVHSSTWLWPKKTQEACKSLSVARLSAEHVRALPVAWMTFIMLGGKGVRHAISFVLHADFCPQNSWRGREERAVI